jgi:hypothetical protein
MYPFKYLHVYESVLLFCIIKFILILFTAGGCLQVNPLQRMTVGDVLERLAAIAETKNISLKEPLVLEGKCIDSSSSPGL